MGWVENLSGKTVGLDTGPLIYYIERTPDYVEILRPFFLSVDRGEISVVTSIITLLEVLVQPIRRGDQYLARRYRKMLFRTKGLTTIPLFSDIADNRRLNKKHSPGLPDRGETAPQYHGTKRSR